MPRYRRVDPPPPSRARRVRRILAIAAGICLIPALISWGSAVTKPSNGTVFVRTVEWLRDNGARGVVNSVENFYYSLTAPAKGGPGLHALPAQSAALGAAIHHTVHYYKPPAIKPVIHPALAGEGQWHPTFSGGGSRPPVMISSYRPSPDYPQVVAGVAWIDHTRTSTVLYPGRSEPAVSLPDRGPSEVPTDQRSRLVATFNSGFKLSDSGGGFAYHGHTYASLQNGLATAVRYSSGKVDIVSWSGGSSAGSDVVYARQNLPLIVNHGQPNPNLSDGPEWGATLGNAILVWRSAVGIDKHGNLLYAAANDQTVHSLAEILIRAGAVRAMELDINSEWTSFITYRFPGAGHPANILDAMQPSSSRYLSPDDRDFFAVYMK
ncbi:MAG TPA: phosphodiester glycosidase family protein [Solirubrobacteraceae bacterium]|nr:phosphodiester glycosidase family protein [Solirubrobacteraceae bacterium]